MHQVISILQEFMQSGKKGRMLLIDPDQLGKDEYRNKLAAQLKNNPFDIVLVGGSLLHEGGYDERMNWLRAQVSCPLVLFPGSPVQIHPAVDAVLFLSLVSGRNAEFLIGQHVIAAPRLRELQLETISTAYMLIDGGKATTASYMSNTAPLPHNKPGIASATAMAAEMLGMACVYLDAGSGAERPVSAEMIASVRKSVKLPIIVGGGIKSQGQMQQAFDAGADWVVIGTWLEESPDLIAQLGQ